MGGLLRLQAYRMSTMRNSARHAQKMSGRGAWLRARRSSKGEGVAKAAEMEAMMAGVTGQLTGTGEAKSPTKGLTAANKARQTALSTGPCAATRLRWWPGASAHEGGELNELRGGRGAAEGDVAFLSTEGVESGRAAGCRTTVGKASGAVGDAGSNSCGGCGGTASAPGGFPWFPIADDFRNSTRDAAAGVADTPRAVSRIGHAGTASAVVERRPETASDERRGA